ncbi:hypothetical protein JOD54_002163 [Actinokineospora baliensis]|uniref:hypothetical protein n=1 Tax=Actinokineospora baliensis TaxID=547056 RepID=UPI00195BA774|nr:hypothetical protein [Actinokineospora baliensis]MBM7771959.1 hypothetical protein [Actinokineospora baliensis]
MNGYICLYRQSRTDVHADTTHLAQQKAVAVFQAMPAFKRRRVRAYDVTVYLAEAEGQHVMHIADF